MHPTISYHLARARIADLCHHAQQAALARAARRARPGPGGHAAPLLPIPAALCGTDLHLGPGRRQCPARVKRRRC
jgi:hypothetical protein